MTARRLAALSAVALLAACGGAPPAPAAPTPAPRPTAAPLVPPAPSVDRTRLPAPGPPPAWAPPEVARWQLANGLPVYFQRRGSTPLVSVLLVSRHGSAADPAPLAGLTALMADLLDEGAGSRSALELSDELARHSIDFGSGTDLDSTYFYMDFTADALGVAVPLLADVVRRPRLSKEEFERRKAQRIADALARESDPSSARSATLRRVLFGDGYASRLADGTQSTLRGITLVHVQRQWRAVLQPDSSALVVVGGVEPDSVRGELERAFGDWAGRSTAKPLALTPAEAPPPAVHLVDFPGSTQSVVTVARRAEPEGAAESFPGLVYARSMGEAFTSRINLNLREEKGYTYGARGAYSRWREAGMFAVSANVKAEVTRESLDEIFRELSGACRERPITATERDEAVQGLLLGFPGRFERTVEVAMQYSSLHVFGRPLDWFRQWPGRVQEVTLADVQQAANAGCDATRYAIVVAGDRAKVAERLASLGPLVLHDAEGRPRR